MWNRRCARQRADVARSEASGFRSGCQHRWMAQTETPAAWLPAKGVDGLGLTKTGALQRVIVREAAERWPSWWNHELFGPPNREAELPVLEETHAGLRGMRLLRKQGETLRTTTRGRKLLGNPEALLGALRE